MQIFNKILKKKVKKKVSELCNFNSNHSAKCMCNMQTKLAAQKQLK